MKNKAYLFLLFFTSSIACSEMNERSNQKVTVINKLEDNFACSVQTSGPQDTNNKITIGGKSLMLGIAVQSLMIAPQNSIPLSIKIAHEVAKYCQKKSYNIEYDRTTQIMEIHPPTK